jgi:hypothetical protein
MNKNTQQIGGVSAIIQALIYVFAFILLFTVLAPTALYRAGTNHGRRNKRSR